MQRATTADSIRTRIRPHLGDTARLSLTTMALAICASSASAADNGYLRSLLDATPQGGWVQANASPFSTAWVTGPSALPDSSHSNPGSIVRAWSSFAWDSNRSNLQLWGGGHANYYGNEMYVWQGADGSWTRGSVSSRVEAIPGSPDVRTRLVVDDAAPQSAHTYDNNIYLPVNDMFLTFGGAAYDDGGNFQVRNAAGQMVRAGPWMWDPQKADPNKVGGTTGSGYNPTVEGGNMWHNRMNMVTGTSGRGHANGTTAYRQEDGKDVVYVTVQAESSGWPALYRYAVGDVRNGGTDAWQRVGISWNAPSAQSAATIDSAHGLYVQTTSYPRVDLSVWDLSKNNAADPNANSNIAVELQLADGTPFQMNEDFGIAYDEVNGKLLLWDGHSQGTVWSTEATFDANDVLAPVWTVTEQPASTTTSQPSGNFATGVLGKWKYVSELQAFVALNAFNATTGDAQVWFYKPYGSAAVAPAPAASSPDAAASAPSPAASSPSPAASAPSPTASAPSPTASAPSPTASAPAAPTPVPEPGTLTMALLALAILGWRAKRQIKA